MASPQPTTESPRASFAASRRILVLGFDVCAIGLALFSAMWIRWDGEIPAARIELVKAALPILILVRALFSVLFGLHRWSFRMCGLPEAVRLVLATFVGTAVLAAMSFWLEASVSRAVMVMEFFFTTTLMGLMRFGPRLSLGAFRRARHWVSDSYVRTLIVGAGSAGDLLIREVQHDPASRLNVVGFVDDDGRKLGTLLGGRRVLGKLDDLAELVRRHRVAKVVIAIPGLPAKRLRDLLRQCEALNVTFKIVPASYSQSQKISAMLQELSPEDLLPRDPIAFDREEVAPRIFGARVLVSGAAGSIGSEICRQVASLSPSSLVLVDINENDLYFLYRHLKEQYPELELHAQIADIRDASRVYRLGQKYQPQVVFHAAAHKHVPLMEDAPDEAVKNNVFGTMHLAQMADRVGAENFVLISTDKAVHPSSIMGATKRIAELIARDISSRSKTMFTAVRFGNVLGSAGSVVPLFKKQIERGGPVTVTHPDCTRYFMTIPEAVGLVLQAGLGGYGELCILDMGEPIRIAELARNLITMAGLVPGRDIQVAYTGLRPGEKLFEELLTEEEEATEQVRNRIKVARSPAPPSEFEPLLQRLRSAADLGDAVLVRQQIKAIVPTYAFTGNLAPSTPAIHEPRVGHADNGAALASAALPGARERM